MVVSSAKRTVLGGRMNGRSLMNAEKRVGPRIEPCGTSDDGKPGEDSTTRVT